MKRKAVAAGNISWRLLVKVGSKRKEQFKVLERLCRIRDMEKDQKRWSWKMQAAGEAYDYIMASKKMRSKRKNTGVKCIIVVHIRINEFSSESPNNIWNGQLF